MSILVHLYYTGKDGNARKFAEEMESSGTAGLIREETGNEDMIISSLAAILKLFC